ncbi:hypothetical protein GQ53DRAFT_751006 [Thozetella sp. PMI_491]|nr:hypothetical protein GQ53DRAFT_751006 [Thozetella sp. PMI_491]
MLQAPRHLGLYPPAVRSWWILLMLGLFSSRSPHALLMHRSRSFNEVTSTTSFAALLASQHSSGVWPSARSPDIPSLAFWRMSAVTSGSIA